MDDKNKMKRVVEKAKEFKMLDGNPLLLFLDIYDVDQVLVYESYSRNDVMNVGMIIKDSLSNELQNMLNDGSVLIVDLHLIGAIPTKEPNVMRE
jgi:hypothetical protein